jgi:hypothetical protein
MTFKLVTWSYIPESWTLHFTVLLDVISEKGSCGNVVG